MIPRFQIILYSVLFLMVFMKGLDASFELTGPTREPDLPRGLFQHQAVVHENVIYVLGGHGSGRRLDGIFMARAAADGSLSAWQSTTPLPPGDCGFMYHSAAVGNGNLYVAGGMFIDDQTGKQGNETRTVIMSPIQPDGTLGEWRVTESLPKPRRMASSIVVSNRLYFIGGQYRRQVYGADIQSDGSLGPWSELQHLISNRSFAALIAYDDWIYVIGGGIIHQRPSDIVFRTRVQPDRTLGRWRRTAPLPVAMSTQAAVNIGRYVVLFGTDGMIYTTEIDDENHFKDWQTAGPWPEDGSRIGGHQAVQIGNHIYVIGGITRKTDRNRVWNTVYRYTIKGESK